MLCAVDSNRYKFRIRGELRTKLEHQHFVSRLLSQTQPHQQGKGPRQILTYGQSLSALIFVVDVTFKIPATFRNPAHIPDEE